MWWGTFLKQKRLFGKDLNSVPSEEKEDKNVLSAQKSRKKKQRVFRVEKKKSA